MPTAAEPGHPVFDRYAIVGSGMEQAYRDIAMLARTVCGADMAAITLRDGERVWFKARSGRLAEAASAEDALCMHAVEQAEDVLVIEDMQAIAPCEVSALASDIGIRFYAGAPVRDRNGRPEGALCVFDREARTLGAPQRDALAALARQVHHLLDLRRFLLEQRRHFEGHERDHAELQRRHDDLQSAARHDPLTGLLNRGALSDLLASPEAMARLDGSPYVLAVADIDHFKQINDRHGHLQGDRVLKAVAEVVRQVIRETDLAVRFGGEEILVVFPHTAPEGAREVAERIRMGVRALSILPGVTISIGLAEGDPSRDDPRSVFDRADRALYRAKASGRDRVVVDGEERDPA